VTNNFKLGVTSTSGKSPSKLIPKLPPNSNSVTKNLTSGVWQKYKVKFGEKINKCNKFGRPATQIKALKRPLNLKYLQPGQTVLIFIVLIEI
jgi:hypothetical protein